MLMHNGCVSYSFCTLPQQPKSDTIQCSFRDTTAFKADLARLLSERIGGSYLTHSPTETMVPVYAVGVGSTLFNGKMDNTDIPKRILEAARTKK